jgi:uncharacterized protein YndB with AHSA1/START domain
MESPEGVRHFSGGKFTSVQEPGLLACVVYFVDENGERIEPATIGFPPDWDGNQTITFTLDDLGARTRLTMRQTGIPSGEIRHMATAGWLTSIDKLHESLVEGRAMVLCRVFDAPRELVWAAWTKPEHLDNWWGPNGFTTKTKEHELRVGGVWRHDMVAADGTVFPDRTEYLEIVEPDRLVYLLGDDNNHEMARTTVSFMEFAGQTHVNMIVVFKDAAACERIVTESNAAEGGKQTLARLADYLVKATA